MDGFGKSPLLAITALMTSAAMAAAGLVLAPPDDTLVPQAQPPVALATPAPTQTPTLPGRPPQMARLTPAPEQTLPHEVQPPPLPIKPPKPVSKPFPPGPYAPAPMVTIPGPLAHPDGPAAPAAGQAPKVRALAAARAAAPSLRGATPPPRPGGKPLPPPLDYAPGPYAPPLVLTLPRAPGGPHPAGELEVSGETRTVAALPRAFRADPPSLKGSLPPPRPGGKPLPSIRDLGVGPYAPPLVLTITTPPAHDDATPHRPGSSMAAAPRPAPEIARTELPSLRGAVRPPHPAGKPSPGPYVPSVSLTIPSPPIDINRLGSPPDPETVIVQSLLPPASEAEPPLLEPAALPPRPAAKPAHERQVAAIAPSVLDEPPSAEWPALAPAPAVNGHRPRDADAQLPPWRRYAALTPPDDGRPMVAIILDDVGLNHRRMARAVALPQPLTLAILPYAERIDGLALRARDAGHELMLHLPMEPSSEDEDPGPNALLADLGISELERRIEWNLARLEGYVGVSNHMGSRFTANEQLMRRLMARLRERGLLFVDSLTTNASVGGQLARSLGVPTATRDIFLDNEVTSDHIAAQLAKVERCARRRGYCIAIGHPHRETLEVLEHWLPTLRAKGLQLVPISAIIARRMTG